MTAAVPLDGSRTLQDYGWSLLPDEGPPFDVTDAASIWVDPQGTLEVLRVGTRSSTQYVLRFFGQDFAAVEIGMQRIWLLSGERDLQSPDTVHMLLDQVLPRVLAHEGHLVLHSGGVAFENRAILILGDSGFGKSTLTARFAQSGGVLLSDDAMLVDRFDGAFVVRPVYPGLRLMPDSLAALFAGRSGSPVAAYTDKKRLPVPLAGHNGPVRLAMIVVLGRPSDAVDLELAQLAPAEGCMAMIRNSFALDPTDHALAAARLERFSMIARHIPAVHLNYRREFDRLPEVIARVQQAMVVGQAI
ncbi:hypothetical protein [Rubellimicrobium roseum]|uniref:Serine kinase n=1 Tax=Rubellimicrobium roseum TaxID=687525 RepID=A0A5C4NFR1_9RHOB|nr:hypothetical protein [Rubellimicrobium roseum]TNC71487.1 hypothetical protein FHG71_11100 [Rubellimicrobium roseum]